MRSLTKEEVDEALRERKLWSLEAGRLVRTFVFPDFAAALAFVNRVGELAEAQDHHPDIDIRYNKVSLGLVTHDANGITRRDVRLAAMVDEMYPAS